MKKILIFVVILLACWTLWNKFYPEQPKQLTRPLAEIVSGNLVNAQKQQVSFAESSYYLIYFFGSLVPSVPSIYSAVGFIL